MTDIPEKGNTTDQTIKEYGVFTPVGTGTPNEPEPPSPIKDLSYSAPFCLFKKGDTAYAIMEIINAPLASPIVHKYEYYVVHAIVDRVVYDTSGSRFMLVLSMADGNCLTERADMTFHSIEALYARMFTYATDQYTQLLSLADFLDNLKKTYELPDGLPNVKRDIKIDTLTEASPVTP